LIVNVNSRANKYVSLTGTYSLNHAMSNTDGIGTFPGNPYSMVGEYGPASTDIRHRMTLGGSINTKWNITFSPLINIASGAPFDITAGRDIYGTTLFNGRPGIATDAKNADIIPTVYGLLDPNPTLDERILHRNYGRGPGTIFFNAHVGGEGRAASLHYQHHNGDGESPQSHQSRAHYWQHHIAAIRTRESARGRSRLCRIFRGCQ